MPGAILCGVCATTLPRAGRRVLPPPVDRIIVPLAYEGAARDLVLGLKLRARRAAAEPLADSMWAALVAAGARATIATWVPGQPRDNRRRGFDHAEVLASSLANRLGFRLCPLLRRAGLRRDQTGLAAEERWRNLEGAFQASAWPAPVLVVDDVVTTGATARSCAVALKAAGCPYVEVVAACSA